MKGKNKQRKRNKKTPKFNGNKIKGVEVIATLKKVQPKERFNPYMSKYGKWDDKTENGPRNNKANQRFENSLKKFVG